MQRENTYISKKTGKRVSMTDIHFRLLLPKRQKEFVKDEPIQIPAEYGGSNQPKNEKQVKVGKRGSFKVGGQGVG